MQDWTIAVIAVACAIGAGLAVGLGVYFSLERRRKLRASHDPFDLSPSAAGQPPQKGLSSQQLSQLSIPYQRYSLNITSDSEAPSNTRGLTAFSFSSAYQSAASSQQQLEPGTFPPPRALLHQQKVHLHGQEMRLRAAKAFKSGRNERSSSESELLTATYASTSSSLPFPSTVTTVSHDYKIVLPSGYAIDPLRRQYGMPLPLVEAAVTLNTSGKKERKDNKKWNSLGNLKESDAEAEFSDDPTVRQRARVRAAAAAAAAASAQPYAYAPYSAAVAWPHSRAARPPSFKHYSKYSAFEEQLYGPSMQLADQLALAYPISHSQQLETRSKHSSLLLNVRRESHVTAQAVSVAKETEVRSRVSSPSKSFGTPTRDVLAVNEAFDFLDSMNV